MNRFDPRARYERQVVLHDGRQVGSWSEEWRAECEALALLNLPGKQRRLMWLHAVEQRRGKAERDRLYRHAMKIHEASKKGVDALRA